MTYYELYRQLADELEAEVVRSKAQADIATGPENIAYSEGKYAAFSQILESLRARFRHTHVRHATDNRKCAACGQDLMHEVHWRITAEGQRYAEPTEKAQ